MTLLSPVRKSLISIILLLFALFSCGNSSRDEVLNGQFIDPAQQTIEFITPARVSTGRPFKVTLLAVSALDSQLQPFFRESTDLQLVGSGSLTVREKSSWQQGRMKITFIYKNDSLKPGESQTIAIKAVTENISASSANMRAAVDIAHSSFKITIPEAIRLNETFTAEIEAIGTDGNLYTAFEGKAQLYVAEGIGNLSVTETPAFSEGKVSLSLSYDGSAGPFKLGARSVDDATIKGESKQSLFSFPVSYNLQFSLLAEPLVTSSTFNGIRLSYNAPDNANLYKIYRSENGGSESLLTQESTGTYLYLDTSVSAGNSYSYRIEAFDGTLNKLGEDSVSITPQLCTDIADGGSFDEDSNGGNATVTVNGGLSLNSDTTYCLKDNVAVNGVLAINEGIYIVADAGKGFTVNSGGVLTVNGTAEKPVRVTSAHTSDPEANLWAGITWASGAVGTGFDTDNKWQSGSRVKYLIAQFASGLISTRESLLIEYSFMRYNQGQAAAVQVDSGSSDTLILRYSNISNNTTDRGVIQCTNWGFSVDAYSNYYAENTGRSNVALRGSFCSSLKVRKSYFLNNTASLNTGNNGGCVGFINQSSGSITGNVFEQCKADEAGGAIYLDTYNSVTVKNNRFINTSAGTAGGAIRTRLDNDQLIENNTFINTEAAGKGGAIHLAGWSATDRTVKNNYFSGTTATGDGGAIAITGTGDSGYVISNNRFDSVTDQSGNGILYSEENEDQSISGNWWGADISTVTDCNSTARCILGGSAFNLTISPASTQQPLCRNNNTAGCVGADF